MREYWKNYKNLYNTPSYNHTITYTTWPYTKTPCVMVIRNNEYHSNPHLLLLSRALVHHSTDFVQGRLKDHEPSEHSFFYFRKPLFCGFQNTTAARTYTSLYPSCIATSTTWGEVRLHTARIVRSCSSAFCITMRNKSTTCWMTRAYPSRQTTTCTGSSATSAFVSSGEAMFLCHDTLGFQNEDLESKLRHT